MSQSKQVQVAALLNSHNRLSQLLHPDRVDLSDYLLDTDGDTVRGCVQVKRLSWCVSEIGHLCVLPDYRRQGIGKKLFAMACTLAKKSGTPALLSTIRTDNKGSIALCERAGWTKVKTIRSRLSGESLHIYMNTQE